MTRQLAQQQIDSLTRKIDQLARDLYREDALVISSLTNYGFIRLSGHIEQVHRILLKDYARRNAAPNLVRFVERTLSRVTNMNSATCVTTLSRFNQEWGHALEARDEMQEGGLWKVALDDTYNVRNSQSHGGAQTANLTSLLQHVTSIGLYFDYLERLLC